MSHIRRPFLMAVGLAATLGAWAQGGPPAGAPKPAPAATAPDSGPQSLNPAVDTSALPARPGPAAQPDASPDRGVADDPGAPKHRAADTDTAATKGARQPQGAATRSAATGGHSVDRLELGTTEISGNRELPKVLYVVPWRRPQLGDGVGRPPNSLIDEALSPVDRDVFHRQNRYYAALQAGAASGKSQPGGASAPPAGAIPKDER